MATITRPSFIKKPVNPSPKEGTKANKPTIVNDPAAKKVVLNDLHEIIKHAEKVVTAKPKLKMGGTPIKDKGGVAVLDAPEECGYIVEHREGSGGVQFSKISGKIDNRVQTILLHKPTVVFPVGAEVGFSVQTFNDRPCAVDPVMINEKNDVQNLLDYVQDKNVIEDEHINEIYMTTLVEEWMRHNHVGETPDERAKNFLKKIGIHSIVGIIQNRIIYKEIIKE